MSNSGNNMTTSRQSYLRYADIGDFLRRYGLILVLLLIIIITSIIEKTFFSFLNMTNILRQSSVIGIVACGMTFSIIGGGLDLSVGAIISLSGVVCVSIINDGGMDIVAILLALLIGLLVGMGNGTIISQVKGRLGETFLITYAMASVVGAIALLYTHGQFLAGKSHPGFYRMLGEGYSPIIMFVLIAAVMQFVLARTKYGRKISFIGANMATAKMSGIRVKFNRTINYMICGLTAATAAVILTSRVNSASPVGGVGYELDAIAAVVVGGTSLTGGSGSILKTILGVLVIGVLGNALNILNVTANPQLIVKGAIIVIAVGLDVWNKRIRLREMVR